MGVPKKSWECFRCHGLVVGYKLDAPATVQEGSNTIILRGEGNHCTRGPFSDLPQSIGPPYLLGRWHKQALRVEAPVVETCAL